jgi:flagellar capping protein FliD
MYLYFILGFVLLTHVYKYKKEGLKNKEATPMDEKITYMDKKINSMDKRLKKIEKEIDEIGN